MRLGLIGLGRIGSFHAQTLAGLDAVDSLVVTDQVGAVTTAIAEKYGAEQVDDPAAMFVAGVDGVVIAAATDAHPELILAALDAGIPVFCEKPVAGHIADGTRVLERVVESGIPVQIGYQRRFDAGFIAAREAVRAGRLGTLHSVRATTCDPGPPPAEYIAISGGIFRDCSVHDFDVIRWVTGQEVTGAFATGSNKGAPYIAAAGDIDTAAAILTLTDNTLVVVSNSRHNGRGYDVRMELQGSTDTIVVGLDDKSALRSIEPDCGFPAGEPYNFFMDRFLPAYAAELQAFTEVVAGTRESPCTVADAQEAGWIAEACTTSLQTGRPVQMDEVRSRQPG